MTECYLCHRDVEDDKVKLNQGDNILFFHDHCLEEWKEINRKMGKNI